MIDMPPSVINLYKSFISNHPESWHTLDWGRFYKFVFFLLICTKKKRTIDWLKINLKEDSKLSDEDIEKYCEVYEHLKNFYTKEWM